MFADQSFYGMRRCYGHRIRHARCFIALATPSARRRSVVPRPFPEHCHHAHTNVVIPPTQPRRGRFWLRRNQRDSGFAKQCRQVVAAIGILLARL